jgi:predicted amidophosphoribosyltransferase
MTEHGASTIPVSPAGHCGVCGGTRHGGFALCFCCTAVVEQLRLPLVPVVAMAEYRLGDRMHRLLRGYKDAPSLVAREARTAALAALVELWLGANEESLRVRFSGGWDLVTTVPSSRGRVGSPADALVERVLSLADATRSLLVRGDERLGHLVAARRGYVLSPDVESRALADKSVLVFDDSVTTGARAQSAAAALRTVGVRVKGILVVGRALGAGSWRTRVPRRGAGVARLG